MIKITDDTVREGLTALVKEFGEDFVYSKGLTNSCLYVRNGEPDCIVGKFLAAQGVPLERLKAADDSIYGTPASELLTQLEREGVLTASDGAYDVLCGVQFRQDQYHTWGVAVSEALSNID